MKKNKNIFGLIMIAVFLTVIVSVSPIKNVIKRVLNDISGATDEHVYLTASFKYLDNEDKEVENVDDVIYVFLCQNEDFTSGNRVTIKLQANNGEQKVTKIYNQNGGSDINGDISGEYYVKVAVPKNGRENSGISDSEKFDSNNYEVYENDGPYNGSYTITFPNKVQINENDGINLNSTSEKKLEIIVKERNGERLTSSDILKPMDLETEFGIFAKTLEDIKADTETTIAVETAKKISANFGLSENNYKGLEKSVSKGKISINKVYTNNDGKFLQNEEVKIGITKKDNNIKIGPKICKTNQKGECTVIFDNLEFGDYTIFEQISGKEVSSDTIVEKESGEKIQVKFSNSIISISSYNKSEEASYNYNYIGKAETNPDDVHLEKMRGPGTLVVDDDKLYQKYKEQGEFETQNIKFVMTDESEYHKIDFDGEFNKLKNLSVQLAKAIDSDDVKVYYMNWKDIETADIDFASKDKEYILVNIDCTNVNEFKIGGRHKRDGVLLYNDGHDKNSENDVDYSFVYNNGAKIIYNFYTNQNGVISSYSGSIITNDKTSGIILAPSASVKGANGNHAGTIIADSYNHETGEVHQKVKPKWIDTDTPAATITNKLIKDEEEKREQDVSIGKVDANKNPIAGAGLQLLDKDNKVIDSWTSTTELHKVEIELVEGASYTIHEVKAPTGYQKAKDYTFTYDEKTITYYMVDTKVIVSKFDEGQSYLPGATLQILDKDDKVIEEWITDDKEHYVNYQLDVGETYTLHEEKAPEGYKTTKDIEFVYNPNDKDQTVEMKDQKIVIGVFIEKKNMNDELLSGAHLQVLDSNGTILDDWISEGTVHRVNRNLNIGEKYTLHEESAPEGYEVSPDVSFEVKNTEEPQIITMIDNKVIIPGEPTVVISKKDEENKFLEEATLQILDKDGKVIEEWITNDKEHTVEVKLNIGEKYTLHEVEAPTGYKVSEDVEFTVKDTSEVQEVKMIDKRIRKVLGIVETLDKLTNYLTIFFASLSVLLISFIIYSKYNKKKLSK